MSMTCPELHFLLVHKAIHIWPGRWSGSNMEYLRVHMHSFIQSFIYPSQDVLTHNKILYGVPRFLPVKPPTQALIYI